VTLSLLVVHDGNIIHERYAPGVDMSTRTRTWSMAKSIAATLIGMLVDQGKMALDNWIKFVRTPAPATAQRGSQYGGHWWLVPVNRTDVPKDAYSTAGNRGQFVIVVPSHELVIVRRGLDGRVSTAGI
jgi:CubicO group peptidase (beta-lactamase class C family)